MMNLNRVTILGNVGSDPKKAATQTGKQVTRLSVATNKRFKEGDDWKTRTTWHQVAVWGDSAEYAAKLTPGMLVFIEGELTYRTYEREIGGVKVDWPVVEIIASSISGIKTNGKEKAGSGDGEKGAAA